MKEFLKYTFATIVGIVIVCICSTIFGILCLAGISAAGSSAAPIENNSVMKLKLNGSMTERAEDNPFASLLGDNNENIGLDNVLTAIKSAKENDKIKGIYLVGGQLSGAQPAMLQEIRDALLDFKSAGKFIVSYADNYTQGCYYLCSTADSLLINPQGMIEWSGLASQVIYFKKLLDKVGVNVQVFKVGTYKSAVEPFMIEDMSEANREQITTYQGEIWQEMLDDVCKSRKIKADKLNELTDNGLMFQDTEFYKKNKLIDKVAYADEVSAVISNMMKDDSEYNETTMKDVAAAASLEPKSMSGNIVAVYYAYGNIVQEESSSLMGGGTEIVGETVAEDLLKLANDDNVKAVVLRVNSGGGSAYASEQIWHQVMNIKAKKPIIVSMGGMAASGGYYISCAADWIVAEPTTVTGSIGIFGTFPEASELIREKLGVNVVTVTTHKFGGFGDLTRPVTADEGAALQAYINRGYELFTKRCADGRGMKQDDIKAIAEGRVWTGVHAKEIGLVDQLGSLEDAIAVAKQKAEIDECTIMSYPAPKTFIEQLMENMNGDSKAQAALKKNLGEYYDMFSSLSVLASDDHIQAAMPYTLKFNF